MDTHKLYKWLDKQNDSIGGVNKGMESEQNRALLASQQAMLLRQPLLAAEAESREDHNEEDAEEQEVRQPIDTARANVERNMPPTIALFAGKQELIRDGLYTYIDSEGKSQKAKRNKPSKKYMLPILNNLQKLDTLLAGTTQRVQWNEVQDCFQDICLACENYLRNRNPWTREGKARKQMISDFYEQVKFESNRLVELVIELGGDPTFRTRTWLDILSEVRTEKLVDGQDSVTVKMGGDGTSNVYVIEKNGVKRYFKESEHMPHPDLASNMTIQIEGLQTKWQEYQKGDHDQEELKREKTKTLRRVTYLKTLESLLYAKFDFNDDMIIEFLSHAASEGKILDALKPVFESSSDFLEIMRPMEEEQSKCTTRLKYLKSVFDGNSDPAVRQQLTGQINEMEEAMKDLDIDFVESSLVQIKKSMLTNAVATGTALISEGSELSMRNVATTRLADKLYLSDLVACSHPADVTINGKRMRGVLMDQALGRPLDEIHRDAQKNDMTVRYSSQAFKQLLSLQLFDIICGQVDRHMKNYLCESRADDTTGIVEITRITGIDNDMSFGLLSYKDITSTAFDGVAKLKNIELFGALMIPFIDSDLAESILELDEETICYEVCDILSKPEREALWDRIKGVQKALNKQMKAEKKMSSKPGFVSSFARDPAPVPAPFQYRYDDDDDAQEVPSWDETYTRYKQEFSQLGHKNRDEAYRILHSFTYLRGEFITGLSS